MWNRTLGSTSEDIVAALVCQIFEGIRDHFVQSVELKFNCFFLMPLIDTFPARLREELECAYEEDLDEVFDVAAVRVALELRLKSLESELHQVERLQQKFAMIHSTLAIAQQGPNNNNNNNGMHVVMTNKNNSIKKSVDYLSGLHEATTMSQQQQQQDASVLGI